MSIGEQSSHQLVLTSGHNAVPTAVSSGHAGPELPTTWAKCRRGGRGGACPHLCRLGVCWIRPRHMPNALAVLLETEVEKLSLCCCWHRALLGKNLGVNPDPDVNHIQLDVNPTCARSHIPWQIHWLWARRGLISAEHQSTGDQNCCFPFWDLSLPLCRHGLHSWDWRKVAGFLNVVTWGAFSLLCLLVSQLIDYIVGEDRSAENPKWG